MYFIGQILPIETERDIVGHEIPPAWYALQVPRQKENAVREMMKARGIHCCYPEREKIWRVQGRTHKRHFPVIPGVVYAKFTRRPHWDVLKARRLINGVFSHGDVPIKIPGDVIGAVMGLPTEAERLAAAQDEMRQAQIAAMTPAPGERAIVASGPLEGLTVDVVKVHDGRIWFETITGIKGEARIGTIQRA